jgi:hypothetical protein
MDVIVFLDQALELAAALRRFGKEGKTGKKRWERAAADMVLRHPPHPSFPRKRESRFLLPLTGGVERARTKKKKKKAGFPLSRE